MTSQVRRVLTALMATVLLVAGTVAGAATPAQASWKAVGEFELCARGNYQTYAVFLQRGFASFVIPVNECWSDRLASIGTEWVEIRGFYRYSPGTFRVAAVQVDMAKSGYGFDAVGTTDTGNHWVTAW